MILRVLIVLLLPTAALAGTGSYGGVWNDVPLLGGPRAFAVVRGEDYPPGQEVSVEMYATSDLPGAEEVFIGRIRGKANVAGKFKLIIVSDLLPKTDLVWKIRYWYSPRTGDVNPPTEFIARRNPPGRK